jgi:hypothetical protein
LPSALTLRIQGTGHALNPTHRRADSSNCSLCRCSESFTSRGPSVAPESPKAFRDPGRGSHVRRRRRRTLNSEGRIFAILVVVRVVMLFGDWPSGTHREGLASRVAGEMQLGRQDPDGNEATNGASIRSTIGHGSELNPAASGVAVAGLVSADIPKAPALRRLVSDAFNRHSRARYTRNARLDVAERLKALD